MLASQSIATTGQLIFSTTPYLGGSWSMLLGLAGTSGALTAACDVYGSNDDTITASFTNGAKVKLNGSTLNLSGTGGGAAVIVGNNSQLGTSPWKYLIVDVTALSGTGAKLTAWPYCSN